MDSLKRVMSLVGIVLLISGCDGGSANSGGSTGAVTLQWIGPSTRTDSSTISMNEISGYRLYYGPSATNTPSYVNIRNGDTMQYTMTLATGSYYFRVSAIDSKGIEGRKSVAVKKTV
ncbi:MAG: hypothetical protein GC149_15705 [Gammaproteobacteria bacterium]|nr:hypothetical protein [Gammaproteobacteria bacterium]